MQGRYSFALTMPLAFDKSSIPLSAWRLPVALFALCKAGSRRGQLLHAITKRISAIPREVTSARIRSWGMPWQSFSQERTVNLLDEGENYEELPGCGQLAPLRDTVAPVD